MSPIPNTPARRRRTSRENIYSRNKSLDAESSIEYSYTKSTRPEGRILSFKKGFVAAWPILLSALLVKLFLYPSYFSTDFEVHRNWFAITSSLHPSKWYYEATSIWTLDYPPLFAWFQYVLAFPARFYLSDMLNIRNLNIVNWPIIVYLRTSVIISEILFYIAAIRLLYFTLGVKEETRFRIRLASILLHPGILIVDNIHFQYNGIMYGCILLIIDSAIRGQFLLLGFFFSILLNLKHIYLYQAFAIFVFILFDYVFDTYGSNKNRKISATISYTSSLFRLIKMGLIVVSVFIVSFGPFVPHLKQIFSRLFPFSRGLCHAYWAPNFWALYAFTDWILIVFIKISSKSFLFLYKYIDNFGFKFSNYISYEFLNLLSNLKGMTTSGEVQLTKFTILFTPTAFICAIITLLVQIVLFTRYIYNTRSNVTRTKDDKTSEPLFYFDFRTYITPYDKPFNSLTYSERQARLRRVVLFITIGSWVSFLFGYHVHEKAVLLFLIPLTVMLDRVPNSAIQLIMGQLGISNSCNIPFRKGHKKKSNSIDTKVSLSIFEKSDIQPFMEDRDPGYESSSDSISISSDDDFISKAEIVKDGIGNNESKIEDLSSETDLASSKIENNDYVDEINLPQKGLGSDYFSANDQISLPSNYKDIFLGQLRINKWFLNLSFLSTLALFPLLYGWNECITKYSITFLYHVVMKYLFVGSSEITNHVLDLDYQAINSSNYHDYKESEAESSAGCKIRVIKVKIVNMGLYFRSSFKRFYNRGSLPSKLISSVLYCALVSDVIHVILQIPLENREKIGTIGNGFTVFDIKKLITYNVDFQVVNYNFFIPTISIIRNVLKNLPRFMFYFIYNIITIIRISCDKIQFFGLIILSTAASIGILMSFIWFTARVIYNK